MVDRRDVGSWLEGTAGRRPEEPHSGFPGERLGMPRSGSDSIARFGRRLAAAFVDWTLCQLIAFGVFHVPYGRAGAHSFVPLGIFVAENLLLVGTLGYTVGHRLLGLQVRSLRPGAMNPLQVLVRTVLLGLFLPAVFWDRDGRGLHDKAAGTVIVRL